MDTAANLAFFQNFYTDTSLYVVAEPSAAPVSVPAVAAAPIGAAAVPQPFVATTPAPAANPTPVAAAPVASAAVGAPLPPERRPSAPAVPPVAAAPLPAPVVVPAAPVPTPPPAPTPPVVTPEAARLPTTLTLAALPAAAQAPAGRVQPTPTQSPVAHIPFSTLGSNANGLIILVRLPAEQFRKLPRNVFLNNLLKALRLIVEDVVLVNVEHATFPVALCSLRQHLAARQFLAFGKNLLDVAVYTTQPYEPVLLYGDTAFLGASEISMLEYDAGRKKQLWQAVQRMFMS
ncbi:hypothetical protein GCM10027346_01700 [Hymenobacter seoulensis]